MERIQHAKRNNEANNTKRTTQGKFAQTSMQRELSARIDDSPKMTAQRKKLQSLFGGTAQLQGTEEEMVQGKFDAVQRVEEEEPLQGKFETAQRVEEEEPLQGKFAVQSAAQLKEASAAKPNNTGLPDNLKSGIENLSGMSMDNVNVHYNSSQPAQLNALAYAQGTDIHVAPGQEKHLPHEAWHVVQQAQGRVQPNKQMKEGVPVNDDKGLEREADVMGARAIAQGDAVQCKSYNQSVIVNTKITQSDLNNWGVVRGKLTGAAKGGEAYDIGSRVNESLATLGLDTAHKAMSGHMIPNRIGGSGKASNVRPWDSAFESGTWENSVEKEFDNALVAANAGDTVTYKVDTDDMSAQAAQDIVDRSANVDEKAKPYHKTRIQEIPLKVSATVGGTALASTDECSKDLIKP